MPWRVILVNDDLNGLVRNDVIPSLAPEPDRKLFPEGFFRQVFRYGVVEGQTFLRGGVHEVYLDSPDSRFGE